MLVSIMAMTSNEYLPANCAIVLILRAEFRRGRNLGLWVLAEKVHIGSQLAP